MQRPSTPKSTAHAPPRSRTDPFSDFTADHNTILHSLAAKRADTHTKQELAKNAGSLLARSRAQEQLSAARSQQSDQQDYYSQDGNHQNEQQPSQMRRLRQSLNALTGGGGDGSYGRGDDDDEDGFGGGSTAGRGNRRSSPSRADLSTFLSSASQSGAGAASMARGTPNAHHTRKGRGSGAAAGGGGEVGQFSSHSQNTSPQSSIGRDSDSMYGGAGLGTSPAPSGFGPRHNHNRHHGSSNNNILGGGDGSGGVTHNTAQHILRDMQGLRESIGRLEQHLMADMKRRVESHAALQRTVELRVREIAENAEKRGQDRTVKLHHTLDSLTQRISKLEGALAVEREKNQRLVQELKYHSVRGLQDIRTQLTEERDARSERIASASKGFAQELFRVEEQLAVAKRARDGLNEEVREAIVRAQEARSESEDKLLKSLMADIRALRGKLESETSERETGEEQLAGAMADLAQHLQSL